MVIEIRKKEMDHFDGVRILIFSSVRERKKETEREREYDPFPS